MATWTKNYIHFYPDPISELEKLKPTLLLNISGSPFSFGKPHLRAQVCTKAVNLLQCPVILCNQVGGNDSLIFDGYSLLIDRKGTPKYIAKGFEEEFTTVNTNETIKEPFSRSFNKDPVSDLYQALVLGVKDYFKKQNFSKACLGLSGGIDSAVVACIAVEALGKENVLAVLMPSRYSSEGSLIDAKELIKKLEIPFKEISIEEPFQSYLDVLTPYFEGKTSNVTEENLQSRIRGMILMALSNKLGYIVLSTGNKSEMAMGYSTLYGDMCGGLGVISDITKRQVYALAAWINKQQMKIPASTILKPPSAELKSNQKDSDSLPAYEIIDTVLHEYMENSLSAEQIAEKHKYAPILVKDLIKRIHANEYKRRQSPPGLRVSEKAFYVGRRFPIVQKWM